MVKELKDKVLSVINIAVEKGGDILKNLEGNMNKETIQEGVAKIREHTTKTLDCLKEIINTKRVYEIPYDDEVETIDFSHDENWLNITIKNKEGGLSSGVGHSFSTKINKVTSKYDKDRKVMKFFIS